MSAFDGQADLLATLIASSATFRTLTATSTVAAAKDRIAIHEAEDEDSSTEKQMPYPRAVISDGGLIERENVGTGTWKGTGSLFLAFEFEAPPSKQSVKQQRAWFVGQVSSIMRESEVVSDSRATPSGYTTTHLVVRRYRRTAGPLVVLPSDREHDDASQAQLRPLWAVEFEIEY